MQHFFYYCFHTKWGHDQICWDSKLIGEPGSLITSNGSYFISLGDQLSWNEFYIGHDYFFELSSHSEILGTLFHHHTLQMIHRMVYEYYTSYRSVIGLFVSSIDAYSKSTQKIATIKKKDLTLLSMYNTLTSPLISDSTIELGSTGKGKQTLVIFPDALALHMRVKSNHQEYVLTGLDTDLRAMRTYILIQQQLQNCLITTQANVFMDYRALHQIIVYFPQTRYYKSQRDPRIRLPDWCSKLAKVHGADLIYID
ncbi:MAG TPA: hypothetical protein PLW93_00970 [Candidatus Absconditabacterales bacterium]|nr:hypothetical protein [Candidatus Absconditabacterales bacterium]HNG96823.1 hypothetical protein [Candidatus Absconditabacterales bacterium]